METLPPNFLKTYENFRKTLRRLHPLSPRRNVSRMIAVLLEIKLRPHSSSTEIAKAVGRTLPGAIKLITELTADGLVCWEKTRVGGRLKLRAVILPKGEALLAQVIAPLLS